MRTDTIVKQEGINALISSLGYVDAERFIMLISKEHFDYTKWRESNLIEHSNVRQLSKAAQDYFKSQF